MLFIENITKVKKQPFLRGFMLEKTVRIVSFIAPFVLIFASFFIIPIEGVSFTVLALLTMAMFLIYLEFRDFEMNTFEI